MVTKRNLLILFLSIFIIILVVACGEEFPMLPESESRLKYGFPPPPNESWTYHRTEKNDELTVTYVSEKVDELVAGYVVYRKRIVGNPPGTGDYIAHHPEVGEYRIAYVPPKYNPSLKDPIPYAGEMKIIDQPDPPIPLTVVKYGTRIGKTVEYKDKNNKKHVTKVSVMAYESVTVPCGTYEDTMKIKCEYYDNGKLFIGPEYEWYHPVIGMIKAEGCLTDYMTIDSESGSVELIKYSPPGTYIKDDSEDEFSGVIYLDPIPKGINR